MRVMVQRRLGLPLTARAAEEGHVSKHGHEFDVMGDLAQNDGEEGHQQRHWLLLNALVGALRSVYGSRLQYEPGGYERYSDTRPDMAIHGAGAEGGLYYGDTKVWDPVGSDPAKTSARGGYVAFGNTQQEADACVHGRPERGAVGTRFDPRTGLGRVARKQGQYERAAREHGIEVGALLFEVAAACRSKGIDPESALRCYARSVQYETEALATQPKS